MRLKLDYLFLNGVVYRLKKSNNPKEPLNHFGLKKFIKVKGDAHMEIDEQKLKKAGKWTG